MKTSFVQKIYPKFLEPKFPKPNPKHISTYILTVFILYVFCLNNLLQSLWFFVSLQAYLSLVILGWWRYSSKSSDFFQVWWKKFVILHHQYSRYQILSSATNLVTDTDSPYSHSRHAPDSLAPLDKLERT